MKKFTHAICSLLLHLTLWNQTSLDTLGLDLLVARGFIVRVVAHTDAEAFPNIICIATSARNKASAPDTMYTLIDLVLRNYICEIIPR